jgi:hypothetical protein
MAVKFESQVTSRIVIKTFLEHPQLSQFSTLQRHFDSGSLLNFFINASMQSLCIWASSQDQHLVTLRQYLDGL